MLPKRILLGAISLLISIPAGAVGAVFVFFGSALLFLLAGAGFLWAQESKGASGFFTLLGFFFSFFQIFSIVGVIVCAFATAFAPGMGAGMVSAKVLSMLGDRWQFSIGFGKPWQLLCALSGLLSYVLLLYVVRLFFETTYGQSLFVRHFAWGENFFDSEWVLVAVVLGFPAAVVAGWRGEWDD